MVCLSCMDTDGCESGTDSGYHCSTAEVQQSTSRSAEIHTVCSGTCQGLGIIKTGTGIMRILGVVVFRHLVCLHNATMHRACYRILRSEQTDCNRSHQQLAVILCQFTAQTSYYILYIGQLTCHTNTLNHGTHVKTPNLSHNSTKFNILRL